MKRWFYPTILLALVPMFMGCDPVLMPCCLDYVYYDDDAHRDPAFEQMCLNAMSYDDQYDLNYKCKLREVDKYVDAAIACCAPLKNDIQTVFLRDVDFSSEDWTAEDSQLLLPLLDQIFSRRANSIYTSSKLYDYDPYSNSVFIWDNDTCRDHDGNPYDCSFKYDLPMNAYTWCLLNTNPHNYTCDLPQAREFEKSLRACCNGDDTSCIAAYIKNNGNCVNASEEE